MFLILFALRDNIRIVEAESDIEILIRPDRFVFSVFDRILRIKRLAVGLFQQLYCGYV